MFKSFNIYAVSFGFHVPRYAACF